MKNKGIKPMMRVCLDPQASVAGNVVEGCHCLICDARREGRVRDTKTGWTCAECSLVNHGGDACRRCGGARRPPAGGA